MALKYCAPLVNTRVGLPLQDQASKDSRAAEKGKVDDPGAKPLKPTLKVLPEK